jgi:hypothetical protein
MALPSSGWTKNELGRRDYFICQVLLAVAMIFIPYLLKVIGPLASMWMFTFRARNAGRQAWAIAGLGIVLVEMFAGEIARWGLAHFGRETVGYGVMGWIILHVVFAVALGVLKPKAQASQA